MRHKLSLWAHRAEAALPINRPAARHRHVLVQWATSAAAAADGILGRRTRLHHKLVVRALRGAARANCVAVVGAGLLHVIAFRAYFCAICTKPVRVSSAGQELVLAVGAVDAASVAFDVHAVPATRANLEKPFRAIAARLTDDVVGRVTRRQHKSSKRAAAVTPDALHVGFWGAVNLVHAIDAVKAGARAAFSVGRVPARCRFKGATRTRALAAGVTLGVGEIRTRLPRVLVLAAGRTCVTDLRPVCTAVRGHEKAGAADVKDGR